MTKLSVAAVAEVDEMLFECTRCEEPFDQATAVTDGDGTEDEWHTPQEGQFGICAHCNNIMKVTKHGLRDLTEEEREEARQDEQLRYIIDNMGKYDEDPAINFMIATRVN